MTITLPVDCGTEAVATLWRATVPRVCALPRDETLTLDASAVSQTGGSFEAYYVSLMYHANARGVRVETIDPHGLFATIDRRYDVSSLMTREAAVSMPQHVLFFQRVGRHVCTFMTQVIEGFAFLGEFCLRSMNLLIHPGRLRLKDLALAFERAGMDGVPITVMIGFLLGLILAFQSAAALQQFGVEVYVADLIAIGLFRELGPLVTAIILAGRSGSAFAAEIGIMKVNEELDALTTFGLPPIQFLVLPRVLAAVLVMPLLAIMLIFAGLIGGSVVLQAMAVPPVTYWAHVTSATTLSAIVLGLVKSAIFGFLVGVIGCSCGVRTATTSDGVGRATTAAVVGSLIAITVADGIIAVLCYIFGI